MTELKVGIAGYGVVGKKRKECVDRHPNLSLVAVCDRNFSDESLLKDGVYYYQNYQSLLAKELDTYPKKIERILKRNGQSLRSKSESQALAIKEGGNSRYCTPTR